MMRRKSKSAARFGLAPIAVFLMAGERLDGHFFRLELQCVNCSNDKHRGSGAYARLFLALFRRFAANDQLRSQRASVFLFSKR